MVFILATAREFRVVQWIKNLAIFTSITFSGQLFNPELLKISAVAFVAFCLLSSGCYIMNDIFDLAYDRAHPIKRYRPVAGGLISQELAIFLCIVLIASSLIIALTITAAFFLGALFYLLLQFSYSVVLKHIAVVDILAIATGYFLRVLAGEFATSFHIPAWLILSAISLSLFLAVGKRRVEFALLSSSLGQQYQRARRSLVHYSEKLLEEYLSIFATATFIFYSLFAFLDRPQGTRLGLDIIYGDPLPAFLERKWLMMTIPFVVFGIMRYMQDIYEKRLGERPEKVLLTDRLLLLNVLIWGVSIIIILYGIRSG